MKLHHFETPAGLWEMDAIPFAREAWSEVLSHQIDSAIDLAERPASGGMLNHNGTPPPSVPPGRCPLYNPTGARGVIAEDETVRSIVWTAFPSRLVWALGPAAALQTADDVQRWEPIGQTREGAPVQAFYRGQADYCEWRVERDGDPVGGAIRRVVFSCEPVDYWLTLANGFPPSSWFPPPPSRRCPAAGSLETLLALYRRHVNPRVELADLVFPCDVFATPGAPLRKLWSAGQYNPWNRWNLGDGLMHLSAPVNAIGAFINQVACATAGRRVSGLELRDPTRLLGAVGPDGGGGGINDDSDPAVYGVVGALCRAGALVTMRDPIAIVMKALDTRGWRLPPHAPAGVEPGDYWKIVRGVGGGALRAEYAVPREHGFGVSDISIDGEPIRYGGQIAQRLTVGIDVSAMHFGGPRAPLLPKNGAAMRFVDVPLLMRPVEVGDPADPRLVAAFPETPTDAIPLMGGYVEPALDDQEIQGNVLAGFHKSHQWMIGFDLVDLTRARRFLGEVAPQLSTLAAVAAYNHAHHLHHRHGQGAAPKPVAWLNLALSSRGLRLLRPDARELASPAFHEGLAARGVLPGGRPNHGEPHLFFVVAADKAGDLGDSVLGDATAIRERAGERGLELVFFHVGENQGGREHFGFKDGVSQPAVRGTLPSRRQEPLALREIDWNGAGTDARFRDINEPELARPGQPLLWPGEFVLGYPAQDPRHPRQPLATPGVSPWWARNGSFAVYLRFKQDVEAFRAFVAAEARRLDMDEDRVAARLVGRWPSGAPLVSRPESDDGVAANHFGYSDPIGSVEDTEHQVTPGSAGDVRGASCPFAAHIRKVNPRDQVTEDGTAARTLKRRILRRGITYGPPYQPGGPHADRGILFVAYQASLEEQFEVLYRDWIVDAERPAGPGGADLLVTGGRPGEGRRFVELLEGGYFFSPAISAVRLLAQPLPAQP